MKDIVTVFTPVYNRRHLLPRLYESLTAQTDFNFEWIVFDDCSEDGSYELAKGWESSERRFPIRVERADRNGGKHRGINRGAALASGFLFFIVDSDDFLTPDAIERIFVWEETIRKENSFAGLGFLRTDLSGKPLGTTFPEQSRDCTSLEREAHHITGDKAEVFYTDVIRRYPFPEFEGERFLSEAVVWDRIAHDGLMLRWINEGIYLCEYQPGGLTENWDRNLAGSPVGYALFLKQKMDFLPCVGYERFLTVYGYFYTVNLLQKRSMRYACRQLDYPFWKACCYMPVRKGCRIYGRIRALLGSGKHH